eukprot:2582337-Pyramimonas_sp.AAC.1
MPCVSGAPWRCVDEVSHRRSGGAKALRRLRGHRTTFRRLLVSFRGFAECNFKRNGVVCLEWPTPC